MPIFKIWNQNITKIRMETISENTEKLLKSFEEFCIKHTENSWSNSKKANYYYDKIFKVVNLLKETNSLNSLSVFYSHPNIGVRTWAACFLLPVNEKQSLKVLKEISKMDVRGSYTAELVIKGWEKRRFKRVLYGIDCKADWLKMKRVLHGKTYIGWMPPEMQCPTPIPLAVRKEMCCMRKAT